MKKNIFGRKFKRDVNERKALIKNLLTSLVLTERIKTSEAKAKAIKGAADKLITKAKKGGQNAYRLLEADVNHNAVVKLVEDLGPRFTNRAGGYTRIMKVGSRVADNASMAMIEWTERSAKVKVLNEKLVDKKKEVTKKPTKQADKKKVEKKTEKKTKENKEVKK